jgi:hypothetical protein
MQIIKPQFFLETATRTLPQFLFKEKERERIGLVSREK